VAISSRGDPRVSFNLIDFHHNFSRLLGVDSYGLTSRQVGEIAPSSVPVLKRGFLNRRRLQGGKEPDTGNREMHCVTHALYRSSPDTFGFENEFNGFADRAVAAEGARSVVRGLFHLRGSITHGHGKANTAH